MNPDLITPTDPGELRDQELQLNLEHFRYGAIHNVPSYDFRMVHAATAAGMGGTRLRVGSTNHVEMYAGHIGYDVSEAHRGHHYASRPVRLLMPLARLHGLPWLWITCDPENAEASLGNCGRRVCGNCECPGRLCDLQSRPPAQMPVQVGPEPTTIRLPAK